MLTRVVRREGGREGEEESDVCVCVGDGWLRRRRECMVEVEERRKT
jgi:hypothetical protein